MRTLRLDYLRAPQPAHWPRWLILVAGSAAFLYASYEATQTERRIEVLEAAQKGYARRGAIVDGTDEQGIKRQSQQIRSAYATLQRLSTPWSTLLDALEATQVRGVRLTAIDPDPRRRTASLSGEARDYLAVLNYVSALATKGGLTDVYLVRHEVRARDSVYPIAFSVSASWARVAATTTSSPTLPRQVTDHD